MGYSGWCDKSDCDCCVIDAMDKGWYNRYHIFCKENNCNTYEYRLDSFVPLLVYCFICGVGWIFTGTLACLGSLRNSKIITFISMIVLISVYLAFAALFGVIWNKTHEQRKCLENQCKEFEKRAKESSNEFLGYSICGFILMPLALLLIICSYATISDQEHLNIKKEKVNPNLNRKVRLDMPSEAPGDTKMEIDATQLGHENEEEGKDTDEKEVTEANEKVLRQETNLTKK